ncbi:MAG TPA: hypothetical protein VIF32_07485 [Gemmatimonadaceae bacterium]
MRQWLAPAHLALTLVIIIWNVVLAGRIAQLRQASKPFAAITGMAGLLLIPACIVAVATTTLITGRAIAAIDWIWPATLVLLAVQAVYATSRRLVNPLWGYPIAFYDVLLAIAAVSRLFSAHGVDLPRPLLVVMAAQVDVLALVTTEAAITSPFFLHVPLVSPAFPALRTLTAGFRFAMALIALAWFGVIVAEIPRADVALASYDMHADDRLTERPTGFAVGVQVLPDVESPPSAASVRSDLETAAWLGTNVIGVVFVPGASLLAIDSVARSLDLMQRDSLLVIATIGYHGKLLPELSRIPLDADQRLATLRRVLTRLRPDVVLPAQDPYGTGSRILGRLPVETWKSYYTRAAAVVREVRPRTRVGLSASAFDAMDSTLFAWASAPGSPVDIVGFSFYPTRLGARALDASFRAADRWMLASPPKKPLWVFATGGYPLAHGEVSQDRAVWATLSWATAHLEVRGLVVTEANDYGQAMGLRAPNGRYRRAATTVRKSIRALRESTIEAESPLSPE